MEREITVFASQGGREVRMRKNWAASNIAPG